MVMPKKDDKEKKTVPVNTRWSPADRAELERKSSIRGMKLTPYLVWLVKKDRVPRALA